MLYPFYLCFGRDGHIHLVIVPHSIAFRSASLHLWVTHDAACWGVVSHISSLKTKALLKVLRDCLQSNGQALALAGSKTETEIVCRFQH